MQVGRYQVLDTIGAGAFSRVARAFDPLIGRTVAVKLFSPDLARGEGRERFLQEARSVGQLSHPNIITLHDMGIAESTSTPYLVMEYLDGQPLDRLLEKGTVPYPRACAWVGHVAEALGVAHRRGIIHGDVKPANIFVTSEGRVKLTDFGMARLARRDGTGSALLGTPAYWCPEQVLGKLQDARSDIFSLGIVLYELVCGVRPFDADSLQGICHRVLSSTPMPPSHAVPSLPPNFDEIISRCLAKQPEVRFEFADALAEALYPLARRKITAAAPAAAPPTSTTLRDRAARLLRSA